MKSHWDIAWRIWQSPLLRKDIERWGSGIKRIYDACHDAGIDVEFKKLKSGFLVVIQRKALPDEELGERLGERLGENEKRILNLLSENPQMSISDIAKSVGISATAVEKNIAKLKKKGLLERIGPARGGYWSVKFK